MNSEKDWSKHEAVLAVAVLLQNVLVIAVLCGVVWFLHASIA